MKAIVLAAGYATRLRPLTDTWAKELLPIAEKPMIDHILDRIRDVEEVDAVHVVTNARKAASFEQWAREQVHVTVHDDGTSSNDHRLGAIGDLQLVIDRAGLEHEDLLVIAGDNLFDLSLADYVEYWRGKGVASAVAVRDVGSRELASRYGIVEIADDDRVLDFVEKPADPPSTLAAIAAYVYHREHVPLVRAYLDEGNEPDQPGRLVQWLHRREPVYGWRFSSQWFDVGDFEQLLLADNVMRRRAGLPERVAYSPE
ncbi:MAG TPA: nucleotidyltransferase family protein [Gaiellaceae bacterium]|nr:nucleotidyltransferase family protein [Gaiellaceae bacterium]